MKKLVLFFNLLVPAIFLVFLASCTPAACFEETNAFLKVSFYNNTTKEQLAPDSLTLIGLEQTTKIYNKATGVQPGLFPLDPGGNSSAFMIRINGVNDTIEFNYTSFPHLISKECGYTFFHTLDLLDFTQNIIDTVLIMNRNITTINEENIRIFY